MSDDERRRVAAALREYASFDCECEDEEDCLVDCADWGERVLNLLSCGDTESACYKALADLVEPSCDLDTPQKVAEEMFGKMRHSTKEEADAYDAMLKSKSIEVRPVDRDALLALADEMEQETGSVCGVCMGKSARRIREALGVQNA